MGITIDWLGTATFRLTIDDLVIFLDAYMDRVASAPKVGLSASEVDKADFVVVGHSHFDHIAGAETIAANTGAVVIGSNETNRVLLEEQISREQLRVAQGGERFRLSDSVTMRVFPSLHACIWIPDTGQVQTDESKTGHLNLTEDEKWCCNPFPGTQDQNMNEDVNEHITSSIGPSETGGVLSFLIETSYGSIFYQDTSGCWTGIISNIRADVAILAMGGRPNVDGEPIQGSLSDYIGMMTGMLKPLQLILGHHDNWIPPLTRDNSTEQALLPVRQRVEQTSPGTHLIQLSYLDSTKLLD